MNLDFDKTLKSSLIALLVASTLGVLVFSLTYASTAKIDVSRSFTVQGEGKAVAVPDVAQFTFSVFNEGGTKMVELEKETSKKVNEVISYLRKNGVESKDISTEEYAVEPRYQTPQCRNGVCPPSEVAGYTVRQTVTVKLRDFEKIGSILSEVANFNVNSISRLDFVVDDPAAVEFEARQKAVAEAKKKAQNIASAADFSLGKLISIYENNYYQPYAVGYGRGGGGDMMMEPAMAKLDTATSSSSDPVTEQAMVETPVIEPGSQDVVINVSMTYSIR